MKTVLISGPFRSISGYGKKAYDIAKAVIEARPDVNVKLFNLSWGTIPNKANDLEPYIIENTDFTTRIDLYIHVGLPNEKYYNGALKSILFSSVNETTFAPAYFVQNINTLYDEIIVPSTFNQKVLENSKFNYRDGRRLELEKPVRVIHEGIKPIEPVKFDLSEVTEKWAFLSVATWLHGDLGEDRKDLGMLIKTFLTTFKDKPNPPALILKSTITDNSIGDRNKVIDKIKNIKDDIDGVLPNIYLIHGELTDEQIFGLYNHYKVKAMVSFTKGESVGRPLLEFAMTGKPVIASGFSGQMDFLAKGHPLLPGELTPVHPSVVNSILIADSKWFTVDYKIASGILKDVKINYTKHHEAALLQKRRIIKEFSFDSMKSLIQNLLDEYVTKLTIPDFLK